MSISCDVCNRDLDSLCHTHRIEAFECQQCDRHLCEDCLREEAVSYGLMSESDAAQLEGAELLCRCEECEADVCPACFVGAEQ